MRRRDAALDAQEVRRVIFLSGGTGTPKLLIGMKEVFGEESLKVVVNTAEDVWVSGNLICPDIDAVIYALAEVIDERKWWGIRNDTFNTHFALKRLGHDEKMRIGDFDRATHILRSELLRSGSTLTEATAVLARRFGVSAEIIPMTDEPAAVRTIIETDDGDMHFQEFWVSRGGSPNVRGVRFDGIEDVRPSERFEELLRTEEVVIIGPSNPITSIGPILRLRGIRDKLRAKKVIAVSPIIGDSPVSGPAAKFMRACGFSVSAEGVLKCYEDFLDALVVDLHDNVNHPKVSVFNADILMKDKKDSVALANVLKKIIGDII